MMRLPRFDSGRKALETRLKIETDRANRYRYYLGVAGWDGGGVDAEIEPSLIEVQSPEELWSRARALVDDPRDVSVLDVGSGVRPFALRRYPVHVCLEPFEPYVEELASRFARQSSVIAMRGAAPEALEMFPNGAFDAVVLVDVVEHLTRKAGQITLEHAIRIARRHVHVFTPDGFMEQHVGPLDDDEWGYVGNEAQSHVSGWTVEDFGGWHVIRCMTYHNRDGQRHGAIWATHTRSYDRGLAPASLHLAEPFNPSELWANWLDAMEERIAFLQATIHPELAPWSFRTSPIPRLPGALVSIELDTLDIVDQEQNRVGHRRYASSAGTRPIGVLVLRNLDGLEDAIARSAAKRVLVIAEEVDPDRPLQGHWGETMYYVAHLGSLPAIPQALDWLLQT